MKQLFTILIPLFFCATLQAQGKRIPVYAGGDSIVYCLNVMKTYNPQADDTLVIMNKTGPVRGVKLESICGVKGHEIVVTQEDTTSTIGGYGSYAFVINKAAHLRPWRLRIDGKNNSNSLFGLGYLCHDIYIDDVVAKHSHDVGIVCKVNPNVNDSVHTLYPWIAYNISFNNVHVTAARTEGFYMGYSHVTLDSWRSRITVPVQNLSITNCTTDSTGWDGFQCSNTPNLYFQNNHATNYGLSNQMSQRSGLQFGRAVTFKDTVRNCSAANGTGVGLAVWGRGKLPFKNITLTNTAKSTNESVVYVDDYDTPYKDQPAQEVSFDGLTINGGNKSPIYYTNKLKTARPIKVKNLTYKNTGSSIVDNSHGKIEVRNVPPPVKIPPVKVDTAVVIKPPVKIPPVVIDTEVVSAPPVIKDDTIRIVANYTLPFSKAHAVIQFTGLTPAKLSMPDKPAISFSFVVQNAGSANLAFNHQVSFSNGKYRLMEKPGETMWIEWRQTKKKAKWIIVKRDLLR